MKHVLLALVLFFVSSCMQNDELNIAEKEQIIIEVQEMFNSYHKDIGKDGLIAEFNYLDHSSDFFWVPPGYNSALSYDSVRTILEANAKLFRTIEFHWDTIQVFPLTNEIANYAGIVKGSMVDTSGITSPVSIIESGTVIKRPDGWKLLSGQSALLGPGSD